MVQSIRENLIPRDTRICFEGEVGGLGYPEASGTPNTISPLTGGVRIKRPLNTQTSTLDGRLFNRLGESARDWTEIALGAGFIIGSTIFVSMFKD